MKLFSRPVAKSSAAPPAGGVAVRWLWQGAVAPRRRDPFTISSHGIVRPTKQGIDTPVPCTCGRLPVQPPLLNKCTGARYASSKTRRSPAVQRAAKQATHDRKLQAGTSSSVGGDGGSGKAIPGSPYPDDLRVLLPAFDVAIEDLGSDFTQEKCLEVVAAGRQIIGSRLAMNEAVLESVFGLTPYAFHTVAVLLLYGHRTVPNGAQFSALALSLLHIAVTSGASKDSGRGNIARPGGYLPSTLTIVNMFGVQGLQSDLQFKRMRQSYIYQNAEKQFLAYLATENSELETQESSVPSPTRDNDLALRADAFTLAGVLAESVGQAGRALRWYKAAREVGNDIGIREGEEVCAVATDIQPREPKWSWEQRCLEAIGSLYAAQMKETDIGTSASRNATETEHYREAKEALRTAALALDSGKAGLLLATKFSNEDGAPSGEKKEDFDAMLHRAAVDAVPGSYEVLAEREAMKAKSDLEIRKKKDEADFHQMLANEWQKLAAASAAVEY